MRNNRRGWQNMPKSPFSSYTGADGKFYTHVEGIPQPTNFPHEMWGIVTGEVRPWIKESADAARFITSQEGFLAVHPMDGHTVWFYDSLNHAKAARNRIEAAGGQCGTNISHFVVGDDGIPEWKDCV